MVSVRNFHRSARAPPAARGHAGHIIRRYDIAGHSLNSRLCRVPEAPVECKGPVRRPLVLPELCHYLPLDTPHRDLIATSLTSHSATHQPPLMILKRP